MQHDCPLRTDYYNPAQYYLQFLQLAILCEKSARQLINIIKAFPFPADFRIMKISYLGILILILSFSACKKDSPFNEAQQAGNTPSVAIPVKDLVAPGGFNFSVEKDLNISVLVTNPSFPGERFVIKIYLDVPGTGKLATTGITNAGGQYSTTLRVPVTQEYIWIEKTGADGSSTYEKVTASAFIASTLGNGQPTPFVFRKSHSGLDCNSGCTITHNNHSGSVTIASGQVACFTGTINSAITVDDGGAVKICGSGLVTNLVLNGNAKVYIIEGNMLTISSINCNGTATRFYNWSDSVIISGSFSMDGAGENHGILYVNGDLNNNTGSKFSNYGTLNVSGNLNVNKTFINYDKVIVNGTFNNNTNAEFFNYCRLYVKTNINNNAMLMNSRYIKCLQTYTQNGSGSTRMDNTTLLSTKNLVVNGSIEGTGTLRGVVKVTDNTTINGSGKLAGMVDLCDSNGVETSNGTIQAPAALSCGAYIPTCPCNNEGFGTPQIQDADGDGVPDNQDEFPNDPLRAFNSYLPCYNVCYTLAFEDLWPATGDYDYNDMVLSYTIQKVLNANNKVVDLTIRVKPLAVGASYENGLGFRLDEVMPQAVATITGQALTKNIISLSANKTEAGQDRAVIICFDSPEPYLQRAPGSMFNTIKANAKGTSDTCVIKVTFATPVDEEKLAVEKLNPFIFTNRRREYEVHMADYKPTSLAGNSLFGTMQDRSNPAANRYYRTANNLPWAIIIPDNFDYPVEKAAVTDAYNFFDDWVNSGGTQYPNWYRNFSFYRYEPLIY